MLRRRTAACFNAGMCTHWTDAEILTSARMAAGMTSRARRRPAEFPVG
jgi:hypothetical protein